MKKGGREGGGSSTPRSSQGGETNRGKEGDREALPPTPRHSQEGEVKSIILGAGWKCCPRTRFKEKKVVAFPRITSIADLILDFLIRFFPPPLLLSLQLHRGLRPPGARSYQRIVSEAF